MLHRILRQGKLSIGGQHQHRHGLGTIHQRRENIPTSLALLRLPPDCRVQKTCIPGTTVRQQSLHICQIITGTDTVVLAPQQMTQNL
ncbi:MAG: hypothetical protein J6866_02260 [Victivallales bacterium]|nr:hypothetical protein [Victivallales bacterium]